MPSSLNSLLCTLLKKYNTLLDCPVRFSGNYGGQCVQEFIDYVDSYKTIKYIPDEQALQELRHLLQGNAHSWWIRRECHFTKWSEAKSALQTQYCKQRPAHLIYKDIFSNAFDTYSSEGDFIDDKLELLNELPEPKPTEKCKLDIIFALLPSETQTRLEYSNISNVMELKQQILKLNHKHKANGLSYSEKPEQLPKNYTEKQTIQQRIALQNGRDLLELYQNMELKQILNGTFRIVSEKNNSDTPSEIVNEKDPVIKVRRTEDLMPHIKQEGEIEEEEFISIETDATNSNESINNFQIDIDIMNQINNIINESEINCDASCDNLMKSSLTGAKDNTAIAKTFLINGQSIKTNSSNINNKINNTIKKKIRCSFCRMFGHTMNSCLKKAKLKGLCPQNLDELEKAARTNSVSPTHTDGAVTSSTFYTKQNNEDSTIISIQPDTTVKSISNLPLMQEIVVVPSVCPTISITTNTSTLPTNTQTNTSLTHISPLSTKLIAPINSPSNNKHLAAKLRNGIGSPALKCHQCGTVGFYKSICPNCSPIYNSNQLKH